MIVIFNRNDVSIQNIYVWRIVFRKNPDLLKALHNLPRNFTVEEIARSFLLFLVFFSLGCTSNEMCSIHCLVVFG